MPITCTDTVVALLNTDSHHVPALQIEGDRRTLLGSVHRDRSNDGRTFNLGKPNDLMPLQYSAGTRAAPPASSPAPARSLHQALFSRLLACSLCWFSSLSLLTSAMQMIKCTCCCGLFHRPLRRKGLSARDGRLSLHSILGEASFSRHKYDEEEQYHKYNLNLTVSSSDCSHSGGSPPYHNQTSCNSHCH